MIDKTHASDVMDVQSYRGGDLDTHIFLVIMKYRQRVAKFQDIKGNKQIKCKVNNFMSRQRRNVYQSKLKKKNSY